MIKISQLVLNKTILEHRISKVRYRVSHIYSEDNSVRVTSTDGRSIGYSNKELGEYFDLVGGYSENSPKKVQIKYTYSIDGGSQQDMEFDNGIDAAMFTGSLLHKKMDGQEIIICSYEGPMYLGKMIYDKFTPEVK